MNNEQKFMLALDDFACVTRDMDAQVKPLLAWCDALATELRRQPDLRALNADGALGKQSRAVRGEIAACIDTWGERWAGGELMRTFSESLADKMVVLVFGKVNAGKSAFCNYLASRFAASGRRVQYFHLEGGQCVYSDQAFAEGATETTARVQGVELGNNLVLLDTPGLHSVTPENGELTRKFTDAADAILWLTSSAAPGQVQELDALQAELARRKPLLAVITRSDRPDIDEVDGLIVHTLQNKSATNRAEQEDYVYKSAAALLAGKLGCDTLRRPVSVSALYARSFPEQADVLSSTGFDRLFEGLLQVTDEALDYKRDKPLQLVKNHIQSVVLADLHCTVQPRLASWQTLAQAAIADLRASVPGISSAVVSEVLAALPEQLDHFRSAADTRGLAAAVSQIAGDSLNRHVRQALAAYVAGVNQVLFDLSNAALGDYEDVFIDVELATGSAKRAAAGALAGAVGGGIGFTLGGPPGAAIGSLIGGWLGDKGGQYLLATRIERQLVGVSYARLHERLEHILQQSLPQRVDAAVGDCIASIGMLATQVEDMQRVVTRHTEKLMKETRNAPDLQSV